MADDGKPGRIRWQPEPGLFAGFSGYVGTVEPALFRIYAPDAPDGEHALCSMLPGMGNKASYGDEAEVKARAEEWLSEFAASLGAVFPPAGRAFTRDELVNALTRLEVKVQLTGPIARMINAESMADCIIQALEETGNG